ncbi:HNH endonuclease [Undibacterium sp. LX40W]|uniref:HNH endonuclease n=1 Tax=Undibacterium nitidum TaxID=2762298 RepID=A0A923KM92_9BURK|nr:MULTISPECIES: HNH endonuclease [Undibacterium]MBC3882660.1 HNH endonuclease [Undibacterium nitidum]MBC3892941.1 HNH endonuclease [Undibacterium sp. LX40W]
MQINQTKNERESRSLSNRFASSPVAKATILRANLQQQQADRSKQQMQLKAIAQMMASGIGATSRVLQAMVVSGSGVVQRSDVVEEKNNATDTLTADKKINTRNGATGWYRFARNGYQINSFASNQTSLSPVGASPVYGAIELSKHPELKKYDIGSISRARHFGAGDTLAGVSASFRKGKWTWHHRISPYEMELVDMGVHKSFYHHGGFSAWQEGTDDDNDD